MEVSRREKEEGIVPDPDIDTYMKVLLQNFLKIITKSILRVYWAVTKYLQAISVEGQKRNLQTDYVLKVAFL